MPPAGLGALPAFVYCSLNSSDCTMEKTTGCFQGAPARNRRCMEKHHATQQCKRSEQNAFLSLKTITKKPSQASKSALSDQDPSHLSSLSSLLSKESPLQCSLAITLMPEILTFLIRVAPPLGCCMTWQLLHSLQTSVCTQPKIVWSLRPLYKSPVCFDSSTTSVQSWVFCDEMRTHEMI